MSNNREIKFKIYHDNKLIGYEVIGDNGWRWMSLDLNPDVGERWTLGVFPSFVGYERKQYTGLKDKNGKEIYEGDILHCHEYDSSDTGHRITQTFNNAVVGFHYGNFYYHPNGNMKSPHQLLMYAYQAEVIGNVYENPELIK